MVALSKPEGGVGESIGERYGFVIQQAAPDSAAVAQYVHDHLAFYGYPPDTKPASTVWLGITRDGRVWGVVGLKPLSDSVVEVPDFYLHRSRWGVLAGYAGLEYLRAYADATGIEIVTATPVWNTKQIRATQRVFGVHEPTHYIYKYIPKKVT